MINDRTDDRLGHILSAIEAIGEYVSGKSIEDFRRDRLCADAVERNIERISEAARHLPDDLKKDHPDIPWRAIADIGNVLRHAYEQVSDERVW